MFFNTAPRSLPLVLLALGLGTNGASAQCVWTHHFADSPPPFGALVNQCITWDPDGAGPAAPNLVIAGFFLEVGGTLANSVARFDPVTQAWSAFGAGHGFEVVGAAAAPNGDLVIGGLDSTQFPLSGPVEVWNGSTWTSLPPMNGQVASVAVLPNGDIVAGGTFTMAGSVSATNIARWDGSSWNPVGTGLGGPGTLVRTLDVRPNGTLVASTLFTPAGGANPTGIAAWDGNSWTAIGNGVTGLVAGVGVSSFHFTQNGDIVASGAFFWPAMGAIRTIARWDGSDWNMLGAGITDQEGPVVAITELPNGDIVAGGSFDTAGGVAAFNIARFDGIAWSAIGASLGSPGTSEQVLSVTTTPDGRLFAGGFFEDPNATNSNVASLDLACLAPPIGQNYCGPAAMNSSGASAEMTATGSDVAGGNPLNLAASNLPTGQFGFFLASQNQGSFTPPGSQGVICIGNPIGRFNRPGEIMNSGANGAFDLDVDTSDIPVSPPVAIQAGETWNFQAWFRDNNPMLTSNFTDGVSVTFQ
ncbi:MAG: hypothetical protein GY711_30495 [bacterium]|nr:hypothetical protein [bacterium]